MFTFFFPLKYCYICDKELLNYAFTLQNIDTLIDNSKISGHFEYLFFFFFAVQSWFQLVPSSKKENHIKFQTIMCLYLPLLYSYYLPHKLKEMMIVYDLV